MDALEQICAIATYLLDGKKEDGTKLTPLEILILKFMLDLKIEEFESHIEDYHWRSPFVAWTASGRKSNGIIRKPVRCFNPWSRYWTKEMANIESENLAKDKCIALVLNPETTGWATACEWPFAILETLLTGRKVLLLVQKFGNDLESIENRLREMVARRTEEYKCFGVKVYNVLRDMADDVIDTMNDWDDTSHDPVNFPVPSEDDVVEFVIKGDEDDIFKLAEVGWSYLDCLKNGRTFRLVMENYRGEPKTDYARAWEIVKAHAKECAASFGLNFQLVEKL